ncbi:AGL257Wp [Eremothecium gossypii ATCC 10895]|uniref:AGL257Wp n=1 Tax=Eremothecium gossypii (strain ATCC 10895 / CBS 109.51 / FGSC 9923 / NRRL Y-1056) TaxID=284811 RepID=Q751G3_EREGS|nr:AGL257Wp [Eremothecium gossypii ATCC 10895]AAS54234.2 AGL257Wp [Eremothecium gossypii ATCC 10895]AEY98560.1 FAGL257Wp [Eremothecium gossypii FDAG1]
MQATLYANHRIRTLVPRALVRHLGLDVALRDPDADPRWARLFPLKKVPCFVGPRGERLTEVIAIMVYLVGQAPDPAVRAALLGHDTFHRARVLAFLELANSPLCDNMAVLLHQVRGLAPPCDATWRAAAAALAGLTALYEARLERHPYLATDTLSLADLFTAAIMRRCFEAFYGADWRAAHPAITRWFEEVTGSPILREHFADYVPAEVTPSGPPEAR